MGITYGDHLIDSGYYDAPEQDRDDLERYYNCPCGGWDCSGLPGGPLYNCPYVATALSSHDHLPAASVRTTGEDQ